MTLQSLCSHIREAMKQRRRADTSTVRGIVSGGQVLANGFYYNMSVAVDIDIDDGDSVWVMIDTTNTRAVVIGK